MNNIDSILSENKRRQKVNNQPYDQITGVGACGERVLLSMLDTQIPHMYIPVAMADEPSVKILLQYDNVGAALSAAGIKRGIDDINEIFIAVCQLRIKYDFEYFCITCINIIDKLTKKFVKFKLNRGQRRVLARLEQMRINGVPIRLIILKARQWGCSTLLSIYELWIQLFHTTNWDCVFCAHIRDAAINVRNMLEMAIEKMPSIFGTKFSIKNFDTTRNSKIIEQTMSRITVGTAIEPEALRSQSPMIAHFSEVAYYGNQAESLIGSITSAIPPERNTMIVHESTPNGVGNFFHNLWLDTKKGETTFEYIFVEWWAIDIYSTEFNGRYHCEKDGKLILGDIIDFAKSLTEEELGIFNRYKDITLENLNWRRYKIRESTSIAQFQQEFPSNDIEAFRESGNPVFNQNHVEALRVNCKIPIALGNVEGNVSIADNINSGKKILENIRFVPDDLSLQQYLQAGESGRLKAEFNKLKIWKYPNTQKYSDQYVVSVDVSKGYSKDADRTVISVIDRTPISYGGLPEVVAQWVGRQNIDITAYIAAQIAKYYNDALLAFESNTYDSLKNSYDESNFIFDLIANVYPNLYCRTEQSSVGSKPIVKFGFRTTRASKTSIIVNYQSLLKDGYEDCGGYIERDNETINEASWFEEKKNGKTGAKDGQHDDRILSRMIGLYISSSLKNPVKTIIQEMPIMKKPVL